VDSALAGLSGGSDSSSEDALMALTGAGRTRTARGADAASTIRSQVAEQVARGLASSRGEDKLTIRLNPESLGQVDVDFSSTGDRLTVVMRASTPEAELALRAGAKELTDGILERAARYQHVEVRVELRDGPAGRLARQDERQQDERHDRQDKGQDGKQDGRRDGRAEGRGRHPDEMFDGAKSAWARAMADLTQEG
jgi:flagellar hook-length control protein FliK